MSRDLKRVRLTWRRLVEECSRRRMAGAVGTFLAVILLVSVVVAVLGIELRALTLSYMLRVFILGQDLTESLNCPG